MSHLLKNKTNFILSCVALSSVMLLGAGCSDKEGESVVDKAASAADSATGAISETIEQTTGKVETVVEEVSNEVDAAIDSTSEYIDEATNNTGENIEEAVENTSETIEDGVENVKEETAQVVEEASSSVAVASVDGAKLYATCAGCHGAKADGGVGPRLNNQSVDALVDKLKRYKAGEQLGAMTGMMAPIAAGMSEAEMEAVSKYSVTLK